MLEHGIQFIQELHAMQHCRFEFHLRSVQCSACAQPVFPSISCLVWAWLASQYKMERLVLKSPKSCSSNFTSSCMVIGIMGSWLGNQHSLRTTCNVITFMKSRDFSFIFDSLDVHLPLARVLEMWVGVDGGLSN